MRAHWVHEAGRRFDLAVVGLVLAVDLAGAIVVSAGGEAASAGLSVAVVVVSLLSVAPLWWRRTRPLTVLLVVCAALMASEAIVEPGLLSQQTGLTVALSVYAVGSWSDRRARAVVVGAVLAVLFVLGAADQPDTSWAQAAAGAAALIGLPFAIGTAARSRRSYVDEVEQRLATAERERDERARRAVADERNRIARELHDVVAHHVSLIGVQAGAARSAVGPEAANAAEALASIEASSRAAVVEMRRLLGALRDDSEHGTEPQPTLVDLGRLVDGFRAAGLEVDLRGDGDVTSPPPSAGLCGYRIVEEALTNVVRHSQATTATVRVTVDAAAVRISVTDPGPARNGGANRAGRGTVGMHERVGLFGGTLAVGPTAGGAWSVEAVLPR